MNFIISDDVWIVDFVQNDWKCGIEKIQFSLFGCMCTCRVEKQQKCAYCANVNVNCAIIPFHNINVHTSNAHTTDIDKIYNPPIYGPYILGP